MQFIAMLGYCAILLWFSMTSTHKWIAYIIAQSRYKHIAKSKYFLRSQDPFLSKTVHGSLQKGDPHFSFIGTMCNISSLSKINIDLGIKITLHFSAIFLNKSGNTPVSISWKIRREWMPHMHIRKVIFSAVMWSKSQILASPLHNRRECGQEAQLLLGRPTVLPQS